MNIVVCVKQAFDTEARITVNAEGKIDPSGVTLVINPLDEYAIEEGLRLKEIFGGEVTILTLGGDQAQTAIRTALAMGADQAIHINDPALGEGDELTVAEILSQALKTIPFDVLLAGVMDTDNGSAQVAVRIAEELGVPSISSVAKLEVRGDRAEVSRVIDGGHEILEVALPAVFTVVQGINQPRYPSVPGIMKAKKKPLATRKLSDLGLNVNNLIPQTKVAKFTLPAPRQRGKILPGDVAEAARELARLLREEARAL